MHTCKYVHLYVRSYVYCMYAHTVRARTCSYTHKHTYMENNCMAKVSLKYA